NRLRHGIGGERDGIPSTRSLCHQRDGDSELRLRHLSAEYPALCARTVACCDPVQMELVGLILDAPSNADRGGNPKNPTGPRCAGDVSVSRLPACAEVGAIY